MSDPAAPVRIIFRIPGLWSHPKELFDRLPQGSRLSENSLTLPDGMEVSFTAAEADDQFAGVFRSSCRHPPTDAELATVDAYTVNVLLSGPGGSQESARAMMQAAAAVLRAGGAGVFIDNSALAHGGGNWVEMADDGGPDALSFAFVTIVRGRAEVWTMGMHTLGLRDVVMKRADSETFDVVEVIRYLAAGEKAVDDGHVLADLDGPRFQAVHQACTEFAPGSPMYNPFGRFRLVSMRDIAESN